MRSQACFRSNNRLGVRSFIASFSRNHGKKLRDDEGGIIKADTCRLIDRNRTTLFRSFETVRNPDDDANGVHLYLPPGDDPCAHGLARPWGALKQDRAGAVALEAGAGLPGDDVVHLLFLLFFSSHGRIDTRTVKQAADRRQIGRRVCRESLARNSKPLVVMIISCPSVGARAFVVQEVSINREAVWG